MLRRLRAWSARAPRVIISLAIVAFALPALAGPLAYCLEGAEGSRVVAAASHCESMSASISGATSTGTSTATDPVHLPAIDEAVGAGAGGVPPIAQSSGLLFPVGGLVPLLSDLLPPRLDAYGGVALDRSSMRSLAGAIAGRSVRLQI
jgi:hypothetical protein